MNIQINSQRILWSYTNLWKYHMYEAWWLKCQPGLDHVVWLHNDPKTAYMRVNFVYTPYLSKIHKTSNMPIVINLNASPYMARHLTIPYREV